MKASIIISFYNKIEFLKLVLLGFERQSFKDFEVIISDDGSSEDIVSELNIIIENSTLEIVHNWHEDNGWRKNIILNKSIKISKSEYIIFVDGDCIPHKDFVKDHLASAEKNLILAGRRVMLGQSYCKSLNEKDVKLGKLDNFPLLVLKNFGDGTHLEKAFRLPKKMRNTFFNSYIEKYQPGVLSGCNFSMHKEDLILINGFDERYLSACVGEDTDLEVRFLKGEGRIKRIKHAAIVYHIWHQLLSRAEIKVNLEILKQNMTNEIAFTPYGLEKTNEK
ncbi:MAG: glycosyltransferase involved in cell wall biosynthesis [Arenicella sp.]|jgi:glycosyltransferase involved in cell wall biosynthesis